MRIGLLSDAHGNPDGLRSALALLAAAGAERLYFLGDAVGYLPWPGEVLDLLAVHEVSCLVGNHEAMLLGRSQPHPGAEAVYRHAHARAVLSEAQLTTLSNWPARRTLEVEDRRLLLVHGSPTNPTYEYVYPDSPLEGFADLRYDAVFMGHTHRPFVRSAGATVVANVGSCGLPRDKGDSPSALVYDTFTNRAQLLRAFLDPEPLIARAAQYGCLHPSVRAVLRRC